MFNYRPPSVAVGVGEVRYKIAVTLHRRRISNNNSNDDDDDDDEDNVFQHHSSYFSRITWGD
jgi:hypothetical protein